MTNERFVELLENAAANIHVEGQPRTYSGRAMYGRQCVGLELSDLGDLMALGAEMMQLSCEEEPDNDDEHEALVLLLKDTRTDDMGRDAIAYWPKVAPPPDLCRREDEDEDDADDIS